IAKEVRNRVLGLAGSLGLVQTGVARAVSMLDVGYAPSAIIGQQRGSVLGTSLVADRTTEAPCVGDWLHFGEGPEPGHRAFDVEIARSNLEDAPERLFELFATIQHTLLLFDGAATTEEGYRTLSRIARATTARCGENVRVVVVVP